MKKLEARSNDSGKDSLKKRAAVSTKGKFRQRQHGQRLRAIGVAWRTSQFRAGRPMRTKEPMCNSL